MLITIFKFLRIAAYIYIKKERVTMRDNIINPNLNNEKEEKQENILRPQTLKEYIGQKQVKENMQVYIEAAKKRKEPLDHVLLYGPEKLRLQILLLMK